MDSERKAAWMSNWWVCIGHSERVYLFFFGNNNVPRPSRTLGILVLLSLPLLKEMSDDWEMSLHLGQRVIHALVPLSTWKMERLIMLFQLCERRKTPWPPDSFFSGGKYTARKEGKSVIAKKFSGVKVGSTFVHFNNASHWERQVILSKSRMMRDDKLLLVNDKNNNNDLSRVNVQTCHQ